MENTSNFSPRKKIVEEIILPDGRKRKRVYVQNDEPSMTDQSQAKACDVNEILLRYQKTGEITHLAKNRGVYADISTFTDLHTALSQVRKAQEGFDSLPAQLRARFNNDPLKFVEYLNDEKNLEESIQLGLREVQKNPLYQPSTSVPTREEASEARKSSSPPNSKKQKAQNDDD